MNIKFEEKFQSFTEVVAACDKELTSLYEEPITMIFEPATIPLNCEYLVLVVCYLKNLN